MGRAEDGEDPFFEIETAACPHYRAEPASEIYNSTDTKKIA